MFRNAMSELGLSGAREVLPGRPSFRPAIEALEERMVLCTPDMPCGMPTMPTTTPDTASVVLAYNLTKATTSLALRLQHSHLSKKGLGHLLRAQKGIRQTIQLLEASDPKTSTGYEQILQTFHQADQVLIKEITALSRGQSVSDEVKSQAIALGQTINAMDALLQQLTNPSM